MDLPTFFALIGAIAAGASAIIAWTARADALRADTRAGKAEDAALQSARDAVEAHKASAHALTGINAFISTEPQRARRRAACFNVLNAFFDLVSLPGQSRDMWHSEEHARFIDAEKQALFDLGSSSTDAIGLGLTRHAFDILRDLQIRGLWDESVCSTIKGVVGRVWEELATESKSEEWWTERRAELLAAA